MSEITSLCEPTSSEADGVLGGRCVDTGGINAGMLRCPRCFSRLLSQCGRLVERAGDEALLHVPRSSNASAEAADGAADSGTVTTAAAGTDADPAADTAPDGACGWDAVPHEWWWVVEDVNDVDNVALSYLVTPPAAGAIRLALCSECRCGPLGYQRDGEAKVWFAAPLLRQQDAMYADDAADFPLPAGLDVAQLQAMLDSGQARDGLRSLRPCLRLCLRLCLSSALATLRLATLATATDTLRPATLAAGPAQATVAVSSILPASMPFSAGDGRLQDHLRGGAARDDAAG